MPVGPGPGDLEAVDLDLDGDVDLVVLLRDEPSISILLDQRIP